MPTKLEDVATPLCDSNIMGKFSNPELVYVNIEFARNLEKWLHVAKEELADTKQSLEIITNDRNGLMAINQIHRDNLTTANQKYQLVDDEIKFYRASLGRIADLFEISQIEMIARSSHERPKETYVDILIKILTEQQALSKAAKTL